MSHFERWAVWITAALTTISGVGLLWTKYFVQSEETWSVINHPLEPWFLKAHIISAPLLVFAIGLIFAQHIWQHYRAGIRRARRTGIVTALFTLPMILTGYLIQVVTHSGWLRALAIAHIVFGLIFALGLLAHQLVMRMRGPSYRRGKRKTAAPEWPSAGPPGGGRSRGRTQPRRKSLQAADRK